MSQDEAADAQRPWQSELERAVARYRVQLTNGMDQKLLTRILEKFPRQKNELRPTASSCEGLCRLIDLREPISKGVKELVFTMIMAALGSQNEGALRSRAIGVIQNTQELIITDAYVGVCCTGMKKVCEGIMSKLLRPHDALGEGTRDTDYDGRVLPQYRHYPHNAQGCERITDPAWNPPAELVRQWVAICRPATWDHLSASRVICLDPLDFDLDEQPADTLRTYVRSIRRQMMMYIEALTPTWYQRS